VEASRSRSPPLRPAPRDSRCSNVPARRSRPSSSACACRARRRRTGSRCR
jgi:hypothetical protein